MVKMFYEVDGVFLLESEGLTIPSIGDHVIANLEGEASQNLFVKHIMFDGSNVKLICDLLN